MIIQYFQPGYWPFLKGEVPIIGTGPSFKRWSSEGRGSKPFWRITGAAVHDLADLVTRLDLEGPYDRASQLRLLAEVLLDAEIVQAIWVKDASCVDPWERCVGAVVDLIPENYHQASVTDWLVGDVMELLDGMSSADYYRTLFSGTHGAELVDQIIP